MTLSNPALTTPQLLLVLAIVFQLIVAIWIVRLMAQVSQLRVWLLIALAFGFHLVRRVMLLAGGDITMQQSVLTLLGSGVMLLGAIGLRPIVLEARDARHIIAEQSLRHSLTIEQLRESQRQMDALLGNLPGMAYRCLNQRDWPMQFVSDGVVALTGYQPLDLVDNHTVAYGNLIHPDDRAMVWDEIQAALARDTAFQIIYRIQTASGEEKWVWEQGCGIKVDGDLVALEGLIIDITAQHLAEAQLSKEKAHYQRTFDAIPGVSLIWSVQPDGTVVVAGLNPAALSTFGIEASHWQGKPLDEILPPDAKAGIMLRQVLQTRQPARLEAEFIIPTPAHEQRWGILDTVPLGEHDILQIFTDLTSVRQAQEDLRQSEAMVQSIMRAAPVGLGVTKDRKIQWTNEQFQTMIGYSAEELHGQDAWIVYPNEAEYERIGQIKYQQINEVGKGSVITHLQRKDGQVITVQLSSVLLDEVNMDGAVVFTALDITERERALQQLKESEAQYRLLAENTTDVIWSLDIDGTFTYVSPSVEQLGGYPPEHWIGQPVSTAIVPESYTEIAKHLSLLQTQSVQYTGLRRFEVGVMTRDNTTVWAEVTSNLVVDEDELVGIVGVARNITERRMMEGVLRQQMTLNEQILDTMLDGYLLLDEAGHILDVNDSYSSMIGYPREDLLEMTIADLDVAITPDTVRDAIAEHSSKQSARFEVRHCHRDGHCLELEVSQVTLNWLDAPLYAAFMRDITEAKVANQALEVSRERFRLISELNSDFAFSLVLQNDTLRWDWIFGATEAITGYTADELREMPDIDAVVHPDDIPYANEVLEAVVLGNTRQAMDLRLVRKDGEIRHLNVRLDSTHSNGVINIYGAATDTTARREAAEALRYSEEKFARAFEGTPDGIALYDGESGGFVDVNTSFLQMLGLDRDAVVDQSWQVLEPLFVNPENLAHMADFIRETGHLPTEEVSLRTPDGRQLQTLVAINQVKLDGNRHFVGVLHDITELTEMEQQLAREHHLLRTLIDSLPDLVYVKDTEGRFLTANLASASVIGAASPEAMIGKSDFDYYPQDIAEFYAEAERGVLEGRSLLNREEYVYYPDGRKRWIITTKVPLFDQAQHVIGLVGVGRDVTELRAALESERDQRVWAESMRDTAIALSSTVGLDAALDEILNNVERVVPHDGADIRLNEDGVARVVRSRGYGGKYLTQDHPSISLEIDAFENMRKMVATGRPVIVADIHCDPDWVVHDNSEQPMHAYLGVPIKWEDAVIGFIHVMSETPGFFNENHADRLQGFAAEAAVAIQNARLFEQVQGYATQLEQLVAERTAALRASENRYRAIVEDQLEMVIRYTPEGVLTFANDAYARVVGESPVDLEGRRVHALPLFEDRGALADYLTGLTAVQPVGVVEQRHAVEHGAAFWIQWTDRVLFTDNQQVQEYQSVGRDVTHLKEMEQQLRQALEREISVGIMRSRFLSMAAHDLRNPLAAIKTTVDLLLRYRDRLPEEKQIARLNSADASIRVMVSMLDDILTIGRVESGRLDFTPDLLDVEAFCWRLVDEHVAATGMYNAIRLHFEVDCGYLYLDERLLRHILTNLLSNAVKYSPDGTPVDFRVDCTGDRLLLEIQDYGIGIPEDEQAQVFESFHRFSNVGQIPGTGLGLAIVQRAVSMHGGTIVFESTEHIGTTFTVSIPLITPSELDADVAAPTPGHD